MQPAFTEPGSSYDEQPSADEPVDDPVADITEITDHTPTTAEEAMDADHDVEGFVNESAYAPTDT